MEEGIVFKASVYEKLFEKWSEKNNSKGAGDLIWLDASSSGISFTLGEREFDLVWQKDSKIFQLKQSSKTLPWAHEFNEYSAAKNPTFEEILDKIVSFRAHKKPKTEEES